MCGEINKNNTEYDAGLISYYIQYKKKIIFHFIFLKVKKKMHKINVINDIDIIEEYNIMIRLIN